MRKRKIYSNRWSEEEIFALIDARAAHDDVFKRKTSQYHDIWKMIQLSRTEIQNRTSQECSKKWNNLLDIYKKLKDPKTGSAPTPENSSNWIYFDKINDLMASKHNMSPLIIIDSSKTTDFNTDDLIEFDPEILENLEDSSSSMSFTDPQPCTSTHISSRNATAAPPAPKKNNKDSIVEYFKERDQKIIKSLEKNNKIMKKVCEKYFPEVDISSSESE